MSTASKTILSIIILFISAQPGISQKWEIPPLPEKLDFCGETVPLDDPDVRERLLAELIINTYKHSTTFMTMLRARRVEAEIRKELKRNKVPEDFLYLAAIESEFQPDAFSSRAAVGYWQFLEYTAKEYGLLITDHIDQRKHLVKSTEAAARYFLKANAKFNSWTLTAAAFNRGTSGLADALGSQKVNNYYDLYLHEETARYVYRILAFKVIMENPLAYGFDVDAEKKLFQPVKTKAVKVSTSIESLPQFAIENGTNYKMLKKLNPWLDNTDYKLIVPEHTTLEIFIPK